MEWCTKERRTNIMIDLSKLSSRYSTRILDESNVDIILDLCRGNPQFYESVPAQPTAEEIRNDMTVIPPGIEPEDKYYFSARRGEKALTRGR